MKTWYENIKIFLLYLKTAESFQDLSIMMLYGRLYEEESYYCLFNAYKNFWKVYVNFTGLRLVRSTGGFTLQTY